MRIAVGMRSLLRFRHVLVLAVLLVLVAAAAPADAQTLLLTLDTPNPQAGACFGCTMAVGDVNGDGKADIVLGAQWENVGSNVRQGRVYVFSGATGALLFTLDTPNPQAGGWFGWSVAVGDVNGDGKADIAVGAHLEAVGRQRQTGAGLRVLGGHRSLLFTLDTPNPQADADFGYTVAVGDVNGDGKADIAVGAGPRVSPATPNRGGPTSSRGPTAPSSSPSTPPTRRRMPNSVLRGGGGRERRRQGRHRHRGREESVAAATPPGAGLRLLGATGALLFTLDTPNPQANAYFGWTVAVGDVNGDGKADIAVGARRECRPATPARGGPTSSRGPPVPSSSPSTPPTRRRMPVRLVRGGGGCERRRQGRHRRRGWHENVGGNAGQGRAYVFSGATGGLLFTLDTPNPQVNAYFSWTVAVGDVNGDGKGDIAIEARGEDVGGNTKEGQAYVFSLAEAGASAGGSGWSAGAYAALAGGLGAAAVVIVGTGWYARRRWLRQRP